MPSSRRVLVLLFLCAAGLGLWWWSGTGTTTAGPVPEVFAESDLSLEPTAGEGGEADERSGPAPRVAIAEPATGERSTVPERRRILGRILDHGGAPCAGAEVRMALRRAPDATGTAALLRVPRAQRTGGDGRFAWLGPIGRGTTILLEVLAAGHAPELVTRDLRDDSPSVDLGDLRLRRGAVIAGRVTDGEGRPLTANVRLLPRSGSTLGRMQATKDWTAARSTDEGGGYRIDRLPPGDYRVLAWAEDSVRRGSATVTVVEDREHRVETLRLDTAVKLSGVVLGPEDEPIEGAELRVWSENVRSDVDGRFEIAHLPSRILRVRVRAPGYIGWSRDDVDPGVELVVRLEPGLEVRGRVTDRSTGAPILRYAAQVRRLRSLQPDRLGDPSAQLERRIVALRDGTGDPDPDRQAALSEALQELEQHRRGLGPRPEVRLRVPPDLTSFAPRPQGAFVFEGLDEGLYVVDVLASEHLFLRSEPFELRRGVPAPGLQLSLDPALKITGEVVSSSDGAPIASALVEVLAGDEVPEPAVGGPVPGGAIAWATPNAGGGRVLVAARSEADGRFELRNLPAGRYRLVVRHAGHAGTTTDVLELRRPHEGLRIALDAAAALHGKVLGAPPGRMSEVRVLLVGGTVTMRVLPVAADGGFHDEALEPGRYVVTAFLDTSGDAVRKRVTALVAGDPVEGAQRLLLGSGEDRALDLTVQLPPTGAVEGSVRINGAPAEGCRVELRRTGSDERRVTVSDAQGGFAVRELEPGGHELRVTVASGRRQELHRAALEVADGRVTPISVELRCGGLRGRVLADDGAPATDLDGNLVLLPGVTEMTGDLPAYIRAHRVHQIPVRDGRYAAGQVSAGPALLFLMLRDRKPVSRTVEIPVGTILELDLGAGARL